MLELYDTIQTLALGVWPKLGIVVTGSVVAAYMITKIWGDKIVQECNEDALRKELEAQGLEPVENAYKCPKCNQVVFGSLEGIAEHFKKPVDEPLPVGLVYRPKDSEGLFYIVSNGGMFVTEHFFEPHTFNHLVRRYYAPDQFLYISRTNVNSKEFKKELGEKYFLLTQKEFEQFEKEHSELKEKLCIGNFIRTTPELEAILEGE